MMLLILQIGILTAVGACGLSVALTREPWRQAISLTMFGLVLTLMFAVFNAPDVALAQLVIGAVGLPLLILLTLATLKRYEKSAHGGHRR